MRRLDKINGSVAARIMLAIWAASTPRHAGRAFGAELFVATQKETLASGSRGVDVDARLLSARFNAAGMDVALEYLNDPGIYRKYLE